MLSALLSAFWGTAVAGSGGGLGRSLKPVMLRLVFALVLFAARSWRFSRASWPARPSPAPSSRVSMHALSAPRRACSSHGESTE